jgi:TolA-binding protein
MLVEAELNGDLSAKLANQIQAFEVKMERSFLHAKEASDQKITELEQQLEQLNSFSRKMHTRTQALELDSVEKELDELLLWQQERRNRLGSRPLGRKTRTGDANGIGRDPSIINAQLKVATRAA